MNFQRSDHSFGEQIDIQDIYTKEGRSNSEWAEHTQRISPPSWYVSRAKPVDSSLTKNEAEDVWDMLFLQWKGDQMKWPEVFGINYD